jgi:hypothetical protein
MTSREIIRRVLARDRPPRVGLNFGPYRGNPRVNDIGGLGPASLPGDPDENVWLDDGEGGELMTDLWGCTWRRIKNQTQGGEVIDPPIKDWGDLDRYQPPDLDNPARYDHCAESREEQADKYVLGWLQGGVSFNEARYLRGFEQYLCDCAMYPDEVRRLNRIVNDIAMRQVDIYADIGADGVAFCEDWGTEDRLLVSPQMWQEMFRPDFERLIAHTHSKGLTFWMHSCGFIKDIIPPLVELGVDVFQFDQSELHGYDFLEQFADRVSYWFPVDIQRTLQTGDRNMIEQKAREMLQRFAARGGGFIGKDYTDNTSIGTHPLWQHWAYGVWLNEGKYDTTGCPRTPAS